MDGGVHEGIDVSKRRVERMGTDVGQTEDAEEVAWAVWLRINRGREQVSAAVSGCRFFDSSSRRFSSFHFIFHLNFFFAKIICTLDWLWSDNVDTTLIISCFNQKVACFLGLQKEDNVTNH